MEEIFQIVFEFVFQALFEFLADAVVRFLPPAGKTLLKAMLCVAFAVLLGSLSTLLLPGPIILAEWLRIAYLIVAPLTLAVIMAWLGRALVVRHKRRTSLETFGFGWLFAFSFALTRYLALKTS